MTFVHDLTLIKGYGVISFFLGGGNIAKEDTVEDLKKEINLTISTLVSGKNGFMAMRMGASK